MSQSKEITRSSTPKRVAQPDPITHFSSNAIEKLVMQTEHRTQLAAQFGGTALVWICYVMTITRKVATVLIDSV